MCVIIYIPTGETITEEELKKAWAVNSDGAGYATIRNEHVLFHRGFMQFQPFYDEIKYKIGKAPLLLHFRISTSKAVNQVQTHPYKKTDIKKLKGLTTDPVICMNGVISGQKCLTGCNDTMSYIKENQELFKVIKDTNSQEVIDLLEEATGSRWAMLTPNNILLSKGFIKVNGKYYSNTNHLYMYSYYKKPAYKHTFKNTIPVRLQKQVKQDKMLHFDVLDHIEFCCNYGECWHCITCLKKAKDITDIENTVTWSKFY